MCNQGIIEYSNIYIYIYIHNIRIQISRERTIRTTMNTLLPVGAGKLSRYEVKCWM